ncbi:neuropeptide Y receptor type 2 isoform X2 [Scleropages formosus]|uniref:Neuropeptide Y receptor type 2 n=1 Tax=Scleropages formosus TaxID=113540 RepID=A0A8C9S3C4_SCLFO|nr:neuropeptide Y receptor type 2-like isoform X2 [Scleropages formosus]
MSWPHEEHCGSSEALKPLFQWKIHVRVGCASSESAIQLNASQMELPPSATDSSNCCLVLSQHRDDTLLDLEDSTKLFIVQLILIVAYSTIIFLGVIGNSLVIYVVYKFKTLHTVTNFFIVNLAVADLLVNTLCLPFTLMYTLHGEWTFGKTLCFVLPYAQGLAVHVSTVTLNVIAVDRYKCIVHHLETKMSKDACLAVIGVTWGVSAVIASPLAIFREYGTFDVSPERSIQVCTEKWPSGYRDGAAYSISTLFLQYILPLSVISFAYVRIWAKLKNHVSPGVGNDRHRGRRKTTKMLVTMVIVFAVSWLPFHAFQLAIDIDNSVLHMKDFKLLYTVFHVVAMCSTFANPILYGWMNKNYQAAFAAVFKFETRSICETEQVEKGRLGNKRSFQAKDTVAPNVNATHV